MFDSKGIIFAADISNKKQLLNTIEQVSQFIEGVKIGTTVLFEHGWRILRNIKTVTDKPIIVDLKIMDIPYFTKKYAKNAFENGADGILICGAAGVESVSVCKEVFRDKFVFVFTQFTHLSGLITEKMADEYIEIAKFTKCEGIQMPATIPNRITKVRKMVGNHMIIISCGVGAQGAKFRSAISQGADYEIIGRAIYDPPNKDLYKSLEEAAYYESSKIAESISISQITPKQEAIAPEQGIGN